MAGAKWCRRSSTSRASRRAASLAVVAWIAALSVPSCSRKRGSAPAHALASDATALALGDSITFGTGAAPEAAYPAQRS